MVLHFENFSSEKFHKPFINHLVNRYENKAIDFLRDQFAPSTRLLSNADLRKVVKLAYKHAKQRGISTEQEHLKYLILVIFWGSYFESDPQYRHALVNAKWLDANENPLEPVHIAPLLNEINAWIGRVQTDQNRPREIIQGFSRIYQTQHDKVTLKTIALHMREIWPGRSMDIPDNASQDFMKATYNIAQANNLDRCDAIMYVCLAQYFGHRCFDDPLYPWIGTALANDGRPTYIRRQALEEAVIKYWDGLLE